MQMPIIVSCSDCLPKGRTYQKESIESPPQISREMREMFYRQVNDGTRFRWILKGGNEGLASEPQPTVVDKMMDFLQDLKAQTKRSSLCLVTMTPFEYKYLVKVSEGSDLLRVADWTADLSTLVFGANRSTPPWKGITDPLVDETSKGKLMELHQKLQLPVTSTNPPKMMWNIFKKLTENLESLGQGVIWPTSLPAESLLKVHLDLRYVEPIRSQYVEHAEDHIAAIGVYTPHNSYRFLLGVSPNDPKNEHLWLAHKDFTKHKDGHIFFYDDEKQRSFKASKEEKVISNLLEQLGKECERVNKMGTVLIFTKSSDVPIFISSLARNQIKPQTLASIKGLCDMESAVELADISIKDKDRYLLQLRNKDMDGFPTQKAKTCDKVFNKLSLQPCRLRDLYSTLWSPYINQQLLNSKNNMFRQDYGYLAVSSDVTLSPETSMIPCCATKTNKTLLIYLLPSLTALQKIMEH